MEFNPTIFKLEVLMESINQAELMQMTESLRGVRVGLEESKTELEGIFLIGEDKEILEYIDKQLPVLITNLKTLNIALMLKEAEVFEHKTEFEALDVHIFCLN